MGLSRKARTACWPRSARAGRERGAPAGSPGVPRALRSGGPGAGSAPGEGAWSAGRDGHGVSSAAAWIGLREDNTILTLERFGNRCIFVPSELLKGGREWHFVVFYLLPWVSSTDKGSSFVSDALAALVETWWYKTSAFSVAVVGITPSTRGLKNPLYRRKCSIVVV